MCASHGEFYIPVLQQASPQQAGVGAEALASKAVLDCDLLHRCCAKYEVRPRVFNEVANFVREPLRHSRRPRQNLVVQQESHEPASIMLLRSSDPIRSKSGGTDICPFRKPVRRIPACIGECKGTTLTTGLPARAMMNGSPSAAAATRRERWVLASCILTVRMRAPLRLSPVNLGYCV